jgi:hypothetical protein
MESFDNIGSIATPTVIDNPFGVGDVSLEYEDSSFVTGAILEVTGGQVSST